MGGELVGPGTENEDYETQEQAAEEQSWDQTSTYEPIPVNPDTEPE